jgi:hypothetical protein
LTRGPARAEPRPTKAARERSRKSIPSLQYQILQAVYENAQPLQEEPIASERRCSLFELSNETAAAGRSARPAPRTSAFAATRRSRGCPIARATTASPTVRARASALCADKTTPLSREAARAIRGGLRKRVNKKEPRF